LWVKLLEMFVTLLSLKYALSVSYLFLNESVKFYLNNMVNLHPLSAHNMPSLPAKW